MEENPASSASRRSCRVVYANILTLHKNLLDVSLIARGGYVFLFVLRLLSLPGVTFLSLWLHFKIILFFIITIEQGLKLKVSIIRKLILLCFIYLRFISIFWLE